MNLFYTLFSGVPVVIMHVFHPARFCQAVERYKVTASLIVPPALLALVRHLGETSLLCITPLD
jgi:4-coumarate--CoA ligase